MGHGGRVANSECAGNEHRAVDALSPQEVDEPGVGFSTAGVEAQHHGVGEKPFKPRANIAEIGLGGVGFAGRQYERHGRITQKFAARKSKSMLIAHAPL